MGKGQRKISVMLGGRPVAYSRPRFRSKWNPKGAGTPQATARLKELATYVRNEVHGAEGWDKTKPVMLYCEFGFRGRDGYTYFEVSPSEFKGSYPKTPDIDNLLKLVMESLHKGGALDDDKQVVQVIAFKREWPK